MKRATILGLVIATQAFAAGNGSVEGTIVDSQTGKVASGVAVSIACGNVRKAAATDATGHFVIEGLPEGTCTLTTGGASYGPASVSVTVTGGSIATILVNVMSKAAYDQMQQAQQRIGRERMKMKKRVAVNGDDFGGFEAGVAGGAPMPMAKAPMAAPEAPMPAPMHAPPPKTKHTTATTKPMATPPAAIAPAPPPPPPRNAGPTGATKGAGAVATTPAIPRQAVKLEEKKNEIAAGRHRIQAGGRAMPIGGEMVNGWATVRVFPVPQYTKVFDGPRDDFRETIYWNPTVETDATGNADVAFTASDAVTSFRATAEGFTAAGAPGGGSLTFQSKLPVTLDAHLPTEVTSGDTVLLPVTIANETGDAIDAKLDSKFGAAFKLAKNPLEGAIHVEPHAKRSYFFPLEVVATDGSGDVELDLAARGLHDQLKKTIRVVPRGFPMEAQASGTVKGGAPAHHTVDLAGALPGSIHASVTMYPSPVAAMTQGMAGMIREPGGCFEQTSSSNYPNVMILAYMEQNDAADPALVQKTHGTLDKGYKLLTGFETTEKGYEWFGSAPGHEALTAYGLMEFADMAKVYDVDKKMMERTADWLMSRRDGKGGFARSSKAVDSFGRASETTTNAYIMWALAEAKRTQNLAPELAAQNKLGGSTQDPYLLALAANTALATAPKAGETSAMVSRLAGMQAKDGRFTGAKETITMSGGESLDIETTSLATLALIKASPKNEFEGQIRSAVDWLNTKRGGYGAWGNTQATILGLKALGAYSEHARQMQAGGKATLVINGKDAGTIEFEKGRRDALVWNDLAGKLTAGKNTIELRLDGGATLPYSVAIEYRSAQPKTSPKTKVAITTQLLKSQTKMGDALTLRAHVENTTHDGIPMTLARVGLPGGTVFQTWQLKELRDKGLIDFYETRPREVILYWRGMAPGAKKDVDLNLLSNLPGTYEAPASSAYLYYTAEDKAWTKPVALTIDK
jgi:hypothetical protein